MAPPAHRLAVFDITILPLRWEYILAVEGNPPLGEQGMFCTSGGCPFIGVTEESGRGASAIIVRGNCASWLRPAARAPSDPVQRLSIKDHRQADRESPRCPPIPDVASAIITYIW